MVVRRSTQPSARGYTRTAGVPPPGRSPAQSRKSPQASTTGSTRMRSTRVWQDMHRSPRSTTDWFSACSTGPGRRWFGCSQALLPPSTHPSSIGSRWWLTRRAAFADWGTSYRQAPCPPRAMESQGNMFAQDSVGAGERRVRQVGTPKVAFTVTHDQASHL